MTGSAAVRVARIVARVRAAYRRRLTLLVSASALAVGLAAFGVAWVLADSSVWVRPTAAPLALVGWVAVAWSLLSLWGWRRYRAFGLRAAARAVERRPGIRAGEVRAALELAGPRTGESATLAERHQGRVSGALGATAPIALGAEAVNRLRTPTRGALGALLVSGFFLFLPAQRGPESVERALDGLRHPIAYLRAVPLPPLGLSVGAHEVRRGEDVRVWIAAEGRDSVALRWQPVAEVVRTAWLPVESGRAAGKVERVEAPTRVWAEAPDGARTGPVEVTPVDPLLLSELRVELRYPRYTNRPAEILNPPLAPAVVPAGTEVRIEGRANRAIGDAELRGVAGTAGHRLAPDGERFFGTFSARPGRWTWEITAVGGEALASPPDTLVLDVVADSVPTVAIVYPGMDTTLSAQMVQPLVIDVRDDYGVSKVELVSWRVSAWGESHPELVQRLSRAGLSEPRIVLEPMLDARERGFFPGDTLRYFARARDNAPRPHAGRSREFVLRLPTLSELREESRGELARTIEDARELAEAARQHARETQALERATREGAAETSRDARSQRGRRGERGVGFEETEAARKALEEAERLAERVAQVREALAEVERALERAGLSDPALSERLDDLRALYEKVLTPELEARLEELQRALTSLDPAALREAVRRLAGSTAEMRDQVERSIKLLERIALEQEFAALAAEARELSRREEAIAESAERGSDAARLSAEEALAAADSLARRAEEFARALEQGGEPVAAERVGDAQRELEASAEAAGEGARAAPRSPRAAGNALRRGAQAARRAGEQLESARAEMAAAWRARVADALQRAQAEALQLGERQRELGEGLRGVRGREEARTQGAAIRRGVQAMGEGLARASEGTLLIDPSVGARLQRADARMREVLESLGRSGGSGEAREGAGAALEALNDLALSLMENRRAIASGGSGTGFEEALQRLAELARGQGQLNEAARALLPLSLPVQALAVRLRQLAGQQSSIGEALREIGRQLGGRGEVLGRVDRMGEEADRIARELERGRLTPELLRRQEELFHRLLDAGRSLERDDFEKERRAERPRGSEIERAGPLPAGLLRGPRYPRPAESELRLYPPAYRRLILDYFDMLNRRHVPERTSNR